MEKGIVAGALFLTSILSPAPTPTPKTSHQPQIEMSVYRVKEGDSLQSIAKTQYGSGDYWTNIVVDNEIIKDPNVIEKDWNLKIEVKKSDKPKELKQEAWSKTEAKTIATPTPDQNTVVTSTPSVTQPVTTAPTQAPTTTPGVLNEAQINFLGSCESGMTAERNSGNGYFGAFQFSAGTWNSMGTGYARADLAPLDVQKDAVQRLVARSSVFGQFPGCSAKMRSLGLL